MAGFTLCPACQAEYEDPLDRRFHAQPNACSDCGPRLWLEPALKAGQEPVQAAQRLLAQGKILAVKGVGGFHLACDAADEAAVARLRRRKGRPDKPLAVMARDLDAITSFAHVSAEEAALLRSPERPIILLRRRPGAALTALVAPGQDTIGVMLPYSPLHYLLFEPLEDGAAPRPALVMTSANRGGEPIVCDNDEARRALATLADAFLLHDRPIQMRCDDSVMRLAGGEPQPVRRSRGYAPLPLALPFDLPPLLAAGGELKAAFCLAKGRQAYLSQHIGDMESPATLGAFTSAAAHFQTLFGVKPTLIACDRHPLYLSRQWADWQPLPTVMVQHHHAHIAAVLAENQWPAGQRVIGFAFDGTGYGDDGAIWGGELLLADYGAFQRRAHLEYVPLAGGEASVRRPYRLALAYLWAAGLAWDEALPAVAACPPAERRILRHQLATGLNSVPSSSMGRLFDAVASLCGLRQQVTYEGQAAMELEALAASEVKAGYQFDLSAADVFSPASLIRAIVADLQQGTPRELIAARFHQAVADLILQLSLRCREESGLNHVALSGGVFQNNRLLATVVPALRRYGFMVLTHRLVPPNDGGLALGQAVVAGQWSAARQ